MRVFISGGGIAGLTLAYWLHQYGIASVVMEQTTSICQDGYGINFLETAYDVAERLCLIDRIPTTFSWMPSSPAPDTHLTS